MRTLLGTVAAVAMMLAPIGGYCAKGFSLPEWIGALKGERGEADQNIARALLWGAGYAFSVANVKMREQGAAPLYCMPKGQELRPRSYWEVVLEYHDRYGYLLDLAPLHEGAGSFQMVILLRHALTRAYPCGSSGLDPAGAGRRG